jgi:hypothetical protein
MIVGSVGFQLPPQMPFIYDDNMIQALSPYGPDNAFDIRILPRRARGRNNLLDTQALDSSSNLLTVNGIPITQQIAWSGIERKSLHQLLGRPPCGGMRCNIEVHDVTAVMAEHNKHIENAKCCGRDREEINPGYTVGMVFEKRPPGLGRRITVSNHVLCNSGLGYLDAKHF